MWAHVSTLLLLRQAQTAEVTTRKEALMSEVEILRKGEREVHKAVGSVRYTGAYHSFGHSLTLLQTAPVSTAGRHSLQNTNVSCRIYHSLT